MSSLINDFKNNPEYWENKNLLDYLLAIQSWAEDMEGFYLNNKIELPININWKGFANILTAAKMFE